VFVGRAVGVGGAPVGAVVRVGALVGDACGAAAVGTAAVGSMVGAATPLPHPARSARSRPYTNVEMSLSE
jgi:hypothetical protein